MGSDPARRVTSRPWRRQARRALIALPVWLALLGAAGALRAEIVAARYTEPTGRYDHGILGDALEWGALELTLRDGQALRAVLPQSLVFEDIAPRLWDVDGDGAPELITVESSLTLGARLAVWGPEGRIAATPHIGQRHRWLSPVGAADLDGDGRIEIAYVDRPHLARVLRIVRLENGELVPVAELAGLTNHRIGWDHVESGIRDCGKGTEIIAANGDWSRVMAVRLASGRLLARSLGPYTSRASVDDALACR